MKRILHITGPMDRAGAETMIMNLYRVIDRKKFQFDFLYFTSKSCDFDDEIENLGGKIYRIVENNPFLRMNKTIKLLLKNPQWQTVHAHTLFSNAFHMYAAYRANVKQRISHSHNTRNASNNIFLKIFYYPLSRKVQAKYATNFVACSGAAGKYLFPKISNIKLLNNSIDAKFFVTEAENNRDYIRRHFDVSNDTFIMLQLGRLHPQKNHQFSIQIAKELKNKNFQFKVFFAGQGLLNKELQEQVKEMGLENYVIFLGMRTDIACLLAGSDLMIMPSINEGFGVVLIEAQAAGIPSLISSTIPKDADLEIDLVNYYYLEEAPINWARKIIEISNKERKNNPKKRFLKLKENGFDNFSNIKEIEELYSFK